LEKLARIVDSRGNNVFECCVDAVGAGATLGEITRAVRISDSPSAPVTPVRITRLSASLEQLREATDRYTAKNGKAPEAVLLNLGSLKEYKARADFSRGFLSVGGYDVTYSEGFKSPEAAVQAFTKSGARVAVICSTDDNYPALVPALAKDIRAAVPDAVIILAGYPQDQVEAHKQSGVNEFIHIRADVLEVLSNIHSRLGIK